MFKWIKKAIFYEPEPMTNSTSNHHSEKPSKFVRNLDVKLTESMIDLINQSIEKTPNRQVNEEQFYLLNVPEAAETSKSHLEYRTVIDETAGQVTRQRPDNDVKGRENFQSRCLIPPRRNENSVGFQFMGKELYQGIEAYLHGTEGDAGYPPGLIQVCVRVFDPNKTPIVWGQFVYRFLLGWDEKMQGLITWLLAKEDCELENVRLEYIIHPGNVVKVRGMHTARGLGMKQNEVLRFSHKFVMEKQIIPRPVLTKEEKIKLEELSHHLLN